MRLSLQQLVNTRSVLMHAYRPLEFKLVLLLNFKFLVNHDVTSFNVVYTDLSAEHPPEGHAGILFHCLEPQPNMNFKIENGFF